MSIVSPELKAEIDQLRQDNYRLRADYTELRQIYDHKCSMLIEAEKYNGWHQLAMLEVTRLRAENERLRGALCNIAGIGNDMPNDAALYASDILASTDPPKETEGDAVERTSQKTVFRNQVWGQTLMTYYCAASNTKQGSCSKYQEQQCIDCAQDEIDRLRAEVAELNKPSALGNLLQECRRLRSALDAIRRHSGKDTDAHQLALEALEAAP